jgi:hypothetical protein
MLQLAGHRMLKSSPSYVLLKVKTFLIAFLILCFFGLLSLPMTNLSHPFTVSDAKYKNWLCKGQYSAGCQKFCINTILATVHLRMNLL